jgi:hypothetical protein
MVTDISFDQNAYEASAVNSLVTPEATAVDQAFGRREGVARVYGDGVQSHGVSKLDVSTAPFDSTSNLLLNHAAAGKRPGIITIGTNRHCN